MKYTFTIYAKMPSMNEYNRAQRGNKFDGAAIKRQWQNVAILSMRNPKPTFKRPVFINYCFYEDNKRRDHDNVSSFAHKVIQDGLVSAGVIKDDGWDYVVGYMDTFYLDRKNPRITVTVQEVANG